MSVGIFVHHGLVIGGYTLVLLKYQYLHQYFLLPFQSLRIFKQQGDLLHTLIT